MGENVEWFPCHEVEVVDWIWDMVIWIQSLRGFKATCETVYFQ